MVAPKRKRELVFDLPCAECQRPLRDHPEGSSPYQDEHPATMTVTDFNRLSASEIRYWIQHSERRRRGDYAVELPPPGERRRIREAAGWTQENLADELEVSRYLIHRFEKPAGYQIGGGRLQGREPGGGVREHYARLLRQLEREAGTR
jgi:hypothetical protein